MDYATGEPLFQISTKNSISSGELRFGFLSAAQKFKLIDESRYAPVIVCYEDGTQLIEMLKRLGPEKWIMRKLQRYIVNLPKYVHLKLYNEGSIIEAHPGIFVQVCGAMYHPELGFCPDKSMIYEPDELLF